MHTPYISGLHSGHSTAHSDDDAKTALLTRVSAGRATACLLLGHIVEIGVPGWEETKAGMIPPPLELAEAAEASVADNSAKSLPSGSR